MIRIFTILFVIAFVGCGTMASFDSPNSLRNINGTLFLKNGKSVNGLLVVQLGNMFGSDIKVLEGDDKKSLNFKLEEVEGFRVRNELYLLRRKEGGIGLGRRISFMRRITPENSRIHLYELREKVDETNRSNNRGRLGDRYETEYYVELPNESAGSVYALGGSKFVPNFDEKMSRVVSDCPSLAQKIAGKRDGYFYAQVGLFTEKRLNVLMNIIEEYNSCGR